jgi:hypothetical protein
LLLVELHMPNYEYKFLCGSPKKPPLLRWVPQQVREKVEAGSFEKRLNTLVEEGWEVVSASTNSVGSFLWQGTDATVFLRREKN